MIRQNVSSRKNHSHPHSSKLDYSIDDASISITRIQITSYKTKQRPRSIEKSKEEKKLTLSRKDLPFKLILQSRQPFQQPQGKQLRIYRAYVGSGNNSQLVKAILRTRFWWIIQDGPMQNHYNLIWTQLRQNSVLAAMNIQKKHPQQTFADTQFYNSCKKIQKNQESVTTKAQLLNMNLKKLFCEMDFKRLKDLFQGQEYNFKDIKRNKCKIERSSHLRISHNHLQNNWHLSNKKALFLNLKIYYQSINKQPFQNIPRTYHIQSLNDSQFFRFKQFYELNDQADKDKDKKKKILKKNIWIIKPGQNTNRGSGISVCQSLNQIQQIVAKQKYDQKGQPRTHIIQQYLVPFLYYRRKFDIRSYILITSVNGRIKGYWYKQGYIRTSCKQFNLKNLANKFIHLTNDAVQKHCQDYGKFQIGNKITFSQFQRYLEGQGQRLSFWTQIYPEMKRLAKQTIKAVISKIDPNRRTHSFQLFGLDYLIDQNFKVWLIQANTNPCLDNSSPILNKIIPSLIDNVFRVALDPLFPIPSAIDFPPLVKVILPQNVFQNNNMQAIYDQKQKYDIQGLKEM